MKRLLTLSAFSFICLSVSACDTLMSMGSLKPSMTEDTSITQRPIELAVDRHVETLSARDVTYNKLMAVSDDYTTHGNSPMYVVFGYDPDKKGARSAAYNRSNIVRGQLSKLDIRDAVVQITPVNNSDGSAVIAYDRITAQGPSGCGTMPGTEDVQTGAYTPYGLGCTVKNMMAKQVANPKDLQGVDGLGEKNDGMASAAVVNRDVRAGETKGFVPSYVLSELANNTTN